MLGEMKNKVNNGNNNSSSSMTSIATMFVTLNYDNVKKLAPSIIMLHDFCFGNMSVITAVKFITMPTPSICVFYIRLFIICVLKRSIRE